MAYNDLLAAAHEAAVSEPQSQEELHAIETAVVFRVKNMQLAEELEASRRRVAEQNAELAELRSRMEELESVADGAMGEAAQTREENGQLRDMIKTLLGKINKYAAFHASLASIFDGEARPTTTPLSLSRAASAASPAPSLSSSPSSFVSPVVQSRYGVTASPLPVGLTPTRASYARSLLNDFAVSPLQGDQSWGL